MKQTAYLSFLLLFTFTCIAQITTTITWTEKSKLSAANVIYYNSAKKLTWADFKGIPDKPDPIAAITSSGFGYNAGMRSKNGKGTINVDIYCYFNKPNSWVKTGKNTPYILNHEQHHFDATYIIAKTFIARVKEAALTPDNMNAELARIYKDCNVLLNKMQDDYDKQTRNGIDKAKQASWDEIFKEKLLIANK